MKKLSGLIKTFVLLASMLCTSTTKAGCLDVLEKADQRLSAATNKSSDAYEAWEKAFEESSKENPDNQYICNKLLKSSDLYDIAAMYFYECMNKYQNAFEVCRSEKNKSLAKRRKNACEINVEYTKNNSYEIYEESKIFCK
jgi:hypothetical protein